MALGDMASSMARVSARSAGRGWAPKAARVPQAARSPWGSTPRPWRSPIRSPGLRPPPADAPARAARRRGRPGPGAGGDQSQGHHSAPRDGRGAAAPASGPPSPQGVPDQHGAAEVEGLEHRQHVVGQPLHPVAALPGRGPPVAPPPMATTRWRSESRRNWCTQVSTPRVTPWTSTTAGPSPLDGVDPAPVVDGDGVVPHVPGQRQPGRSQNGVVGQPAARRRRWAARRPPRTAPPPPHRPTATDPIGGRSPRHRFLSRPSPFTAAHRGTRGPTPQQHLVAHCPHPRGPLVRRDLLGPLSGRAGHHLVAHRASGPRPQSTTSWSIVTVPASGRRRTPPISTSPPPAGTGPGHPVGVPERTVATRAAPGSAVGGRRRARPRCRSSTATRPRALQGEHGAQRRRPAPPGRGPRPPWAGGERAVEGEARRPGRSACRPARRWPRRRRPCAGSGGRVPQRRTRLVEACQLARREVPVRAVPAVGHPPGGSRNLRAGGTSAETRASSCPPGSGRAPARCMPVSTFYVHGHRASSARAAAAAAATPGRRQRRVEVGVPTAVDAPGWLGEDQQRCRDPGVAELYPLFHQGHPPVGRRGRQGGPGHRRHVARARPALTTVDRAAGDQPAQQRHVVEVRPGRPRPRRAEATPPLTPWPPSPGPLRRHASPSGSTRSGQVRRRQPPGPARRGRVRGRGGERAGGRRRNPRAKKAPINPRARPGPRGGQPAVPAARADGGHGVPSRRGAPVAAPRRRARRPPTPH